jgi:predicted RNase H-like HicB family nuclease
VQHETNTKKIVARLLREGWENVVVPTTTSSASQDRSQYWCQGTRLLSRCRAFDSEERQMAVSYGVNSMTRYVALVEGERASFGLIFPDLPGCVAMGKTMDEVVRLGTEALSEWVIDVVSDGLKLPRARTMDQLFKDPEVQEDLARGSVFVSIPLILDCGRSARANISLDAGLLNAVDEEAQRHGVTRSAFLAAAAREKIKASA